MQNLVVTLPWKKGNFKFTEKITSVTEKVSAAPALINWERSGKNRIPDIQPWWLRSLVSVKFKQMPSNMMISGSNPAVGSKGFVSIVELAKNLKIVCFCYTCQYCNNYLKSFNW